MTDTLLRILCETGVLDYGSLARAASCNRLLYPVCEILLRPAVAKKKARLLGKIKEAFFEKLELFGPLSLHRLEQSAVRPGRPIWWEQRGRWGPAFCIRQLIESDRAKDASVRWLKSCWQQGIREKFKYSPDSIRSYRQLSEEQRRVRMDHLHLRLGAVSRPAVNWVV
jgi:hypothetical protein